MIPRHVDVVGMAHLSSTQYSNLRRRALVSALDVATQFASTGRPSSAQDLDRWARAITLCLLDDADSIDRFAPLMRNEPHAHVRPRRRSCIRAKTGQQAV